MTSRIGARLQPAVDRIMVPLHRRGFTPWVDTPISGWQALLTTTRAEGGGPRDSSVHYVVVDDAAFLLAVAGPDTPWLADLRAAPTAQLHRPTRAPVTVIASEVSDASVRARIVPRVLRSTGVAGVIIGTIPQRATDAELLERVADAPLLRLTPSDGSELRPGPDDPGGHGWIWRQGLLLGLGLVAVRVLRWSRRWV